MKNRDLGNFDINWGDWLRDLGWVFAVFAAILVALMFIFLRQPNWKVNEAIDRHDKHIKIETLAKIPKGPYLHRVVDTELNRVCYLNAVGGGIKCFDLDETVGENDKLRKDLLKYSNDYRKYSHNNSYYYNDKPGGKHERIKPKNQFH